jgi:hypothetical protein
MPTDNIENLINSWTKAGPAQASSEPTNPDDLINQWNQEGPIQSFFPSGGLADFVASTGSFGKALVAMGQGASDSWGAAGHALSKSEQKILDKVGLGDIYKNNSKDLVKSYSEAFARGTLWSLNNALKTGAAFMGAISGGAQSVGHSAEDTAKYLDTHFGVVGKVLAAPVGEAGDIIGAAGSGQFIPGEVPMEAPESEEMFRNPITEPTEGEAPEPPKAPVQTGNEEDEMGHWPLNVNDLLTARAHGILGEGEQGYFNTVPPSEENIAARETAAKDAGIKIQQHIPPLPDIHDLARQIDPDTFQDYDNHAAHKQMLRETLSNLAAAKHLSPDALDAKSDIDNILDKVNGVESKLTKRQAERLADARSRYEDATAGDTPEMSDLRQQILDTDYKMRDLAPAVTKAYKQAEMLMPDEDQMEILAKQRAEQIEAAEEEAEKNKPVEAGEQPAKNEEQTTEQPEGEEESEQDEDEDTQLKRQHINAIYNDVKTKLLAIGRPEEQADAEARLQAVHYMTLADNLEGSGKTGLDLYNENFPELKKSGRQPKNINKTLNQYAGEIETRDTQARQNLDDAQRAETEPYSSENVPPEDAIVTYNQGSHRGALDIVSRGKNVLSLFKSADASTFMHEMAHQWLEELQKYASHEDASADLKKDLQTVRDWFNLKDGEKIDTEHHEMFARGFERYLMEGKAPTPELQSLFDKFKQWLTEIYHTVTKLKAPITDDIREVYGRLLHNDGEELSEEEAQPDSVNGSDTQETSDETTEKGFRTNPGKIAQEHDDEVTQLETEGIKKANVVKTLGQKGKPKWKYADILKPTKTSGGSAVSATARKIADETVEEGLTDVFPDLVEREKMNVEDQARQANQILAENPDYAKQIAMGQKPAPEGVNNAAVFMSVYKDALARGDLPTLIDLANRSRLTNQLFTEAGRTLRLLSDRGEYDFMSLYQDLNSKRALAAEKFGIDIKKLDTEDSDKLMRAVNKVNAARKRAELDWQTSDSSPEYGKAIADLKDLIENLTPGGKTFVQKLSYVGGLSRAMLTSVFHMSAPITQMWGMMSRSAWLEGLPKMFGYFADEENFKDLQAWIYGHKYYKAAMEGKLGLTELGSNISAREEQFQNNILEDLNTYLKEKTGVPNLIRANGRAFTGFNNFVRFKGYANLMDAAAMEGYDITPGSRVANELAEVINNFSGRGKLTSSQTGMANDLQSLLNNTLLFAPKKLMGTIQMFNPYEYIRLSKPARMAAIRNLSGSLLATATVLGVARAFGAKIELNLLNTDFGKFEIGNTKFDMTGGNAVYIRTLARIIMNKEITSAGIEKDFDTSSEQSGLSRADVAISFLRNKLAPVASIIVDGMVGRDAIGRPFTVQNELRDKMVPIVLNDYVNFFYNDPDNTAAILPALSAIFGVQMESPLAPDSAEGMTVWGDPYTNYFIPPPRNDIDRELDSLGHHIHLPPQSINGFKLTDDQYKEYIYYSGSLAKQQLMGLIHSQGWNKIPDNFKWRLINSVVRSSRATAQTIVEIHSLNSKNNIIQKILMKNSLMTGTNQ